MQWRRIFTGIFFFLLVSVAMLTYLLPKRDFSQTEDRALAPAPVFSWEALLNGAYQEQAEAFLADHIAFRDIFVRGKTRFELLEGKRELNGVIVAADRLMENLPAPGPGVLEENARAVKVFLGNHPNPPETVIMLVPTASEFYPEKVPWLLQVADQTRWIQEFYEQLSHLPRVNCVDAYTPLAAEAGSGIFYRTDSRWTSQGAYVGYSALSNALGYKAAAPDTFNIEHASHNFLGNLYSRALTGEEWQDTVDLYTYAAGDPVQDVVKKTVRNQVIYSSIFFREELASRDQYRVFLGENQGVIRLRTGVRNGKKLLIFHDGFANALIQFLPLHYEEIALVEPAAFRGSPERYLSVDDYQQVLFLYSLDSFVREGSLAGLSEF